MFKAGYYYFCFGILGVFLHLVMIVLVEPQGLIITMEKFFAPESIGEGDL